MEQLCSEPGCTELAVMSVGERSTCRGHYLTYCYRRLEAISQSVGVKNYSLTQEGAEAAGQFLQECMRTAADFATSEGMPSNLERAQVYDVLLWASELHGRLRRSPRKAAKFPILLRSEIAGRVWEVRTETQVISRHGMRIACNADIRAKDTLICIRLDNGRRAEATVAWASRRDLGVADAGLELVREDNFWGIVWGDASPGSHPQG